MDYMNIGERAVVPGTDITVVCIVSAADCSKCALLGTQHCAVEKCSCLFRDDGMDVKFVRGDIDRTR